MIFFFFFTSAIETNPHFKASKHFGRERTQSSINPTQNMPIFVLVVNLVGDDPAQEHTDTESQTIEIHLFCLLWLPDWPGSCLTHDGVEDYGGAKVLVSFL